MKTQIVILSAGQSSRFFPFNQTDKSLYQIMGQPILAHTLSSIAKTDFTQVIIVVPPLENTQQILRDYIPSNLQVKFVTLPQPLGQGEAILAAAPHIQSDCFVLNSEQFLFHQLITDHLDRLSSDSLIGFTFRQTTDTPEKYGIFDLEGDRVKSIVEKPTASNAPSDQRLVGVYYLTQEFLNILKSTPTSQYSLEAAINTAASAHQFLAFPTSLTLPSLKYPWDVLSIKSLLLSTLDPKISDQAQIAPTATIRGDVFIDKGARVGDYALIEGPAYLGPNSLLGAYSQLRGGSVIEAGVELQRYADIKNSHIQSLTKIHSGFIGDSVIGTQVRIAADFLVANRRLDRTPIKIHVKDQPTDTRSSFLGCFIGDHTSIGIRASLMPGTVIGPKSQIGPGVYLKGTHPSGSLITASNITT